MLNKYLVFIALNCTFLLSIAQPESYEFTLDQCIDYGLENNIQVRNTRFDEYIAAKDIQETWATALPQIDGFANVVNNFQLPIFVLPTETGEFQEVTFGLPWQAVAQASGRQLLFDAKFFIGLKASESFYELSQKTTNRSQEDAAFAISQAFYTALTSKEVVAILKANYERIEKLFYETKALNENGLNEKIDVERVQINLTNVELELNNAERQSQVSIDLLKFQMGMPINAQLSIKDNIDNIEIEPISLNDFQQINIENRVEYNILNNSIRLQELNLQRFRLSYLPELNATASYSWNRQWEPSTPNQFEYFVGAAGLELSFPIFDGLQRLRQSQRAKIELWKAQNDLDQFILSANLELKQSATRLQNAYNNLNSLEDNRDLAKEVYRVAKVKYTEGIGSSLEVNDAESQIRQTESNYISGLFDYLIAKTEYQKAKGEFSKYHR